MRKKEIENERRQGRCLDNSWKVQLISIPGTNQPHVFNGKGKEKNVCAIIINYDIN